MSGYACSANPTYGSGDLDFSCIIRDNRDLIFVVVGFSLPSIPLAVSIAGRGASSEALAFLAGIYAHNCLCRWVQSLLRGAKGITIEVARSASVV